MTSKIISVLVGVPASGKTTYRNSVNAANFVVVSSDDIIEELCANAGVTYNEGFSKFINEATRIFNDKLGKALNNGECILVDRTNLTKRSRNAILSRVPDSYYREAIVLPVPEMSTWIERLASRPDKQIPGHVLKNMVATYEVPTEDEGFDTVIFKHVL
jgi:predicted kinase